MYLILIYNGMYNFITNSTTESIYGPNQSYKNSIKKDSPREAISINYNIDEASQSQSQQYI